MLRQDGHRAAWLTTDRGSRAAGWKVIGTSPRGETIVHGMLWSGDPCLAPFPDTVGNVR